MTKKKGKFLNYYCLLSCLFIFSFPQTDALFAQDSLKTDYHNIALGNKDKLRKANINIGISGDIDSLQGVQTNLFSSVIRRSGKGFSGGIFAALTVKDFTGVQLSSITNIVGGTIGGVQMAGVMSAAKKVTGVQFAGMNNISGLDLVGVQLSGICNISMGVRSGAQISGVMNVCAGNMNGFQFSAFNYCDTLNGGQFGLVNICISHPKGMQIGLVNYMRDDVKRRIGLVNISPQTNIQMLLYGGNTSRLNIAARFLNPKTYSMLGLGTHYMGLSEKFSGALFYRTGLWFSPYENAVVSTDLGFYHIETFDNADEDTPERLYSLQARVNYEYKINPVLKFFFSTGYGVTRYYDQNEFYRKRFLFDMGITLF